MLADRARAIVIASLVLLCIFGCVGVAKIAQKGSEGQAPVRRLRVTIDVNQREELFARFRQFADKHNFEIQIRRAGPNAEGYFIEMWREDLYVNATITRVDPNTVSIGFFDRETAQPASANTTDELVTDLRNLIDEMPNVTITEQK